MSQQFHNQGFIIMIEQDAAEKDYTAYIPALRLGAKGHTLEEVRDNARDLILMEVEAMQKSGKSIPSDDNCIVETLSVSLTV
ncbi:type II toxin-antitoxin system HicB family antitoxin (plasmid) [Paenibacillus urinalis]|uniref:Type II toxin-antitoxin system HicB family antitoxin n=2 Tax=Paenibacillus TaxID=44249 RepID=A0AAX3N6B8_9BACL|nr:MULTISPECIES: type II toxin-antitoxin system HicB family antitoxin [Paenibacillus]MCM3131094.1 type II toxin-antitoxin system HicB family antitoxin [Paenibacillus sp. MER 78]WDH85316.1 type II toxin-antitoxin system HicB family antitoxin [Paenibacillus urinalis]WDH95076.1 type II toxin-antitoxin system HicB family antitoxin [Paenibacillus urinalis]WDI05279.1 type II toxin-antitoxin system HicB family antitoxin [Paenibacillus urinalis]SDX88697.1 Predicted nuclease of the RNAse H fold, HicB f